MGVTTLSVAIANAANPDVTEHLEFIVDSGAVYSVVPTPVLERLGIPKKAKRCSSSANTSAWLT